MCVKLMFQITYSSANAEVTIIGRMSGLYYIGYNSNEPQSISYLMIYILANVLYIGKCIHRTLNIYVITKYLCIILHWAHNCFSDEATL